LDYNIAIPQDSLPPSVSKVTLLQAAWGIVLARSTRSEDVVLNLTLTGRNARVIRIEEIVAPTVTQVPVRFSPSAGQSVRDYLDSIQERLQNIVPYEQTRKDDILGSSKDAELAVAAAISFVVHPSNPYKDKIASEIGLSHTGTFQLASRPTAFAIDCSISDTGYDIYVVFNDHIVSKAIAQRMVYQLEQTLWALVGSVGSQSLGSLDMNQKDIKQSKIKISPIGKGLDFAGTSGGKKGRLLDWVKGATGEFMPPGSSA
jgi:hypothetical protein